MSKYNLERLGWYNFEQLVGRLLREVIGPGISTFSGSTDQGRDATFNGKAFFPANTKELDGQWIFQTKYRQWGTRGVEETRRDLKSTLKKELNNVLRKHALSCDIYILITNSPLTAQNIDAMEGIIKKEASIRKGFIVGEDALEGLLDLHPKVVRAFPQLMGISQLRELSTWNIHQRTLSYLVQAQRNIETYVVTDAYLKALELLHKQHFCVITGAPKMGKTCTADAITAAFSIEGFSIVELRSQQDFYKTQDDTNERQLFICDDVFGDITLSAEKRDDWARGLEALVNSLGKTRKLLWTARSYILKEAMGTSKLREERASLENTDNVTVSVDSLKRIEKAMILYNHAKRANLAPAVKTILNTICIEIIDHDHFSPESIRQLCSGSIVKFVANAETPNEVMKRVSEFLSSPGESWKTAYRNASREEQFLCLELMAQGGHINIEVLRERYDTWRDSSETSLPFNDAFSRAEDTFFRKKQVWQGEELVTFYHPSMRDLLVEVIEADQSARDTYIKELSISEFTSLVLEQTNNETEETSAGHQVSLDKQRDLLAIKSHLDETLLPRLDIYGANMLLAQLAYAVDEAEKKQVNLSEIVTFVLDSTVKKVCSDQFGAQFQKIYEGPESISFMGHWIHLFNYLGKLLLHTKKDCYPLWASDLITSVKDYTMVEYWELVQSIDAILPLVIKKYVDVSQRESLHNQIENDVRSAISEFDDGLFETDWSALRRWHEEYGDLPRVYDSYVDIFPDDEPIGDFESLQNLIDDYPEPPDGPDYDDYEPDYNSDDSYSSGDNDIHELFSDI